MERNPTTGLQPAQFAETDWSRIAKAARPGESGSAALEQLCHAYWAPLYHYARHRGLLPADAEDLVQSFFQHLLQREALQRADPGKGRFRSFLLGSLRNFMANEWDRRRTRKRGGGCTFVSLEELKAETLYAGFTNCQLEPEKLFDRSWAAAMLERTVAELRKEYEAEGRLAVFEGLSSVISKEGRTSSDAEMAKQLGMAETAVRMAAHRLRRRFGKLLRRHISRTVADPADVEDELRYLISCW